MAVAEKILPPFKGNKRHAANHDGIYHVSAKG